MSQFEKMRKRWDASFEEYFVKNIHPDVPKAIGRFVLEPLGIYNPYSGVTNNQSEGFNRVMKDLQGWKEAPLDCTVLALYLLQSYYNNEIKRGLSGMGEYHVLSSVGIVEQEQGFTPTSSPSEIVEGIRNKSIVETATNQELGESIPNHTVNTGDPPTRPLSGHARACKVVSEDNISFDPKLHVFNVKGTSGTTRVVTLYPRETCSCPASRDCYHILATKYSIGMQPSTNSSQQRSHSNLSQLRKNTRSRSEKKSGRKRPRPNDVDIDEPQAKGIITIHVLRDCNLLGENKVCIIISTGTIISDCCSCL